LTRGIRVTGQGWKLSPTAVGSLLGEEAAYGLSDDFVAGIQTGPSKAEKLKCALFSRPGVCLEQPIRGTLHGYLIVRELRLWPIDLEQSQGSCCDLDVIGFDRWLVRDDSPSSIRPLLRFHEARQRVCCCIGQALLGCQADEDITYGVGISRNPDALQ